MKTSNPCSMAFALITALMAVPAAAHGIECAKPFQQSGSVTLPVNYSGATGSVFVPAGYRLQIEYVSTSLRVTNNTDRAGFSITTTAGGTSGNYQLPASLGYSTIDWISSSATPLYADKNSTVQIYLSRIGAYSSATTGQYALSGCLYPA